MEGINAIELSHIAKKTLTSESISSWNPNEYLISLFSGPVPEVTVSHRLLAVTRFPGQTSQQQFTV